MLPLIDEEENAGGLLKEEETRPRWNEVKTYSRIKQATRDAIKRPGVDQQRQRIRERNNHYRLVARAARDGKARGLAQRHGLARVGHPQKVERSHEFAQCRNQVGLYLQSLRTLFVTHTHTHTNASSWFTVAFLRV